MTRQDEIRRARRLLDEASRGAPAPARGASESGWKAWRELELPEPAPPPPGFAARIAARAVRERTLLPGFALAPRWANLTAALLVVVGVAGGAGLGAITLAAEPAAATESELFSDEALLDDFLTGTATDEATASPSPDSEPAP
jgi:hypothetical protein